MAPRVWLLPPRALGRQQTTNCAQASEGADAFMKSLFLVEVVNILHVQPGQNAGDADYN